MHGLIFGGLREFAEQRLGAAAAAEIWAGTAFELDAAYPDEDFLAQVERVRAAAGVTHSELEREFGSFTAQEVFLRLYPDYYDANAGCLPFLLGIEEKIHEVVRTTIPGALPPKLHVRTLGADGVLVSYTSERQLCRLLEGLLLGVAAHYGERVALEEIQCMHRDDPGCVFTVQLEQQLER